MRTLLLRLLLFAVCGIVIIAAFATGGYYSTPTDDWTPHSRFVEWALSWGSLGAAVVVCCGIGLFLIGLVRSRILRSGWSIAIFVIAALGTCAIPPFLMLTLRDYFGQYLFYGDSGFALAIMPGFMFVVAIAFSVAFAVYVLRHAARSPIKVA